MNNIDRRAFLIASAQASAGFAVAFYLPEWEAAAEPEPPLFEPNAYISIARDNKVTLWVTRSEMGQGVRTNLPAALAEELDVDLARVNLQQAMPGARFKGIRLRTSGSGSSSGTFGALRKAGATAREMLISAAASTWNVDPMSCRADSGTVIHVPSGRSLNYGALVAKAAQQPVPVNPPLKNPATFRLIGKPLKRIDAPQIVRGTAVYGLDVHVPGMLFAVIERCPYLGGRLVSFDANKALQVPQVRGVFPITKGISTGVAVVGDNTWAALKGREALKVEWNPGPNQNFDSEVFAQELESAFALDGYPIRRDGDAPHALQNSSKTLDAVYHYPFEAHAPVETMNCIADVREDSCEVWVSTQTPETAHENIMKMLGLPSERIKVHTTLVGGGFGRRLFVDYVDEAVELSKQLGKPVKVLWTRTDDTRHGFFHPASAEQMRAGIDADGRILAWVHKSVGSDLSMFGLPTAEQMKDLQRYAKDEAPWGAFDTPYNFSALKVDYVPVDSPVPTGAWRSVDYPSRVFARESFLDEVARAAGRDPLQLRIDLLAPGDILKLGDQNIDRGRMIRVLELSREKSNWLQPLNPTANRLRGRGLAINIYEGESYIAQVAEVSLARDLSDLKIERIVCVVDCGFPINPLGLEGQVESGITWGLSATLHGKIDFQKGQVVQQSYRDFRVMRMNEMPRIETHIVPSISSPGGFGEHAVPPVAPAVTNAIFDATGKRLRRLPFAAGSLEKAI